MRAEVLTPAQASAMDGLSEQECRIAMEALCGACVVKRVRLGAYSVGARIFYEYVRRKEDVSPTHDPPSSAVTKPKHSSHVISLHGIRTRGVWQKILTRAMGNAFSHDPWDYGWFAFFKLIRPGQREREIENFRDEYHLKYGDRGIVPSVIAHSFGTYIVARAMEKYPDIRFDQMILCGSILPPDFQWSGFDDTRFARMLHDYGGRDFWAKVVEWVVPDAGPSGSKGFKDPAGGRIIERHSPRFRHSDYFYSGNFTNSWIPFLRGGVPLKTVELRGSRNWKFRLVVSLGVALVAAVIWSCRSQPGF
jgi:pimeloyl-ACP methyl ester carboxylesterase